MTKLESASLNDLINNRVNIISDEIVDLRQQIAAMQSKIEKLEKNRVEVWNVNQFKKEPSFNAIAYLVSLIEGKEYVWKEKEIEVPFKSGRTDGGGHSIFDIIDFRLVYLIENEKNVDEIIDRLFPISPIRDPRYNNRPEGERENHWQGWLYHSKERPEELETPNDDFIQLTYYMIGDADSITYNYNFQFDNSRQSSVTRSTISSKICDKKYHYVIDFMTEVAKYRTKKPDLEITQEEMFELAVSFATEYQKENDKLLDEGIKIGK